jgi:GTP 3',8-cyclase
VYDRFNRKISYLRISVTDRCNLRCVYCMPEEGIKLIRHEQILSFEEIVEVVKVAVAMGISKVRITGGEPLVRKGIVHLVEMISGIKGISDLSMTTNGTLLNNFADDLANAGLQRVNISLDSVNPSRFHELTRGGNLAQVLQGINAAGKAGLSPVKINCVIKHSASEQDAVEVGEFCRRNKLEVRFIHEMNLESGCFTRVEGGDGGDCGNCTRLRLTANGMIKPCLFSNLEFSIRDFGIQKAIEQAVNCKPEKGTVNNADLFHNIGG